MYHPHSIRSTHVDGILPPTRTSRLHNRMFGKSREHPIHVKSQDPGRELTPYLVDPKYRAEELKLEPKPVPTYTTRPAAVVYQYSKITRNFDEPTPNASTPRRVSAAAVLFLTGIKTKFSGFRDAISQKYRAARASWPPFTYSALNGTSFRRLGGPQSLVAGSAMVVALLLAFRTPLPVPKPGSDGAQGQGVVRYPSAEESVSSGSISPTGSPTKDKDSHSKSANPSSSSPTTTQPTSPQPGPQNTAPSLPSNGGGYGSGVPATPPSVTEPLPDAVPLPGIPAIPPATPPPTTTPIITPPNLIQDVLTPQTLTVPGQSLEVNDKTLLKTNDTTLTIN
jgi:hypothetical protein